MIGQGDRSTVFGRRRIEIEEPRAGFYEFRDSDRVTLDDVDVKRYQSQPWLSVQLPCHRHKGYARATSRHRPHCCPKA